jgi:NAD(P)-dependent dehydrogenase (short-subunit alcohol dehydrogenase family)
MKLVDRVAIVTGGAQGIGRAIAEGLARQGAAVMIADVNAEGARETAAAVAAAPEVAAAGGKARAAAADVGRLSDIDALVTRTVAEFGRLDILVNNAGIALAAPLLDVTEELWDRQMAINLKAAFFATQKAAEVMIKQGGGGKILNLASTSGFVASSISMVPYDISKAGVRMLTISSAVQLAPHRINVNALAPGTIDTDLTRSLADPERLEWYATRKIPWGRMGQPKDLAGAAVFLCSDDADYITGHTLVVDGGWLLL